MSDLLIKGLKLPERTNELRLIIHPNGQTIVSNYTYWEETEAIEVPEHGRLGDLDMLYEKMRTYNDHEGARDLFGEVELIHRDSILYAIEDAPTVIPADKEEI